MELRMIKFSLLFINNENFIMPRFIFDVFTMMVVPELIE